MAAPTYLASSYRYFKRLAPTDVQTIIDDVVSELTAASWTDGGSGYYKSPVDSAGRFMKIKLTRVSATNLELAVRDQNAAVVGTRRMTLGTTPTVHICCGEFHLHICRLEAGGADYVHAFMLDQSPETQGAHNKYVVMSGSRNTSDSWQQNDIRYWSAMDNVTATHAIRSVDYATSGNNGTGQRTVGNNPIFHPVDLFICPTSSGNLSYCGRCYQAVLIPTQYSQFSVVKVPIDTNTLGEFLVSGVPGNQGWYFGLRIA